MDLQKLCDALRRGSVDAHRCLGCGYEHDCSIHGCRVMKQAADQLEKLQKQAALTNAEKQASCRLGQMDMRESAAAKLRSAAANVYGIARAALEIAAELIEEMETLNSETGQEEMNAKN